MIATAIPAQRRTSMVVGTSMVAKRILLKFVRTPQLVIGGIAQMVLFLVCFRYVLGGAIQSGGGVSYVDFLVPGFIATGVLFAMIGAVTASTGCIVRGMGQTRKGGSAPVGDAVSTTSRELPGAPAGADPGQFE
jgi:ABC-2 type transport system permease protein